jgi:diaminopimelate decarboxylase
MVDRLDASDGESVALVGRHCESGDVLIDAVRLADPRVGDLLGVPTTGAYCFTMANNYNGTRRIPVVFVADGAARLVVRRETWADLLARDVDDGSA